MSNYLSLQLSYGGGLSGNDIGLGPSLGPIGGGGGLGPLSLGRLPEDTSLMGGRMGPLDVGQHTRLGVNGGALEQDAMRGGIEVLPLDAASTLFVDGLPQDCSRREAARILNAIKTYIKKCVCNL